ncbi:MAG: UDP-2,4-diacetamido-2,4,6-trideoxy-beta-L-altropyranose hydrolase [Desulfobacteraceae bacterium]|nr:UDP-2,4-diacetamido-2,4,6-trideoxy-beta-L-altropyranose hydrolase [Desulfobacteraceae bacterium]
MKILVRADSSITIGTGHLIRCLTLADALKERAEIHFVCRDLQGNLSDLVKSHGHSLHLLPAAKESLKVLKDDTAHSAWLEVSWQDDLKETQNKAQSITEKFDWLIVDNYALDYRWERGCRNIANKIMVIDDLADRCHDCDLLLDQNYFTDSEKRYNNLVSDESMNCFGPEYALLRPEFRAARKFAKARSNVVTRILVYFGGYDHDNLSKMTLKALSCPEFEHLYVDVVVGQNNSYMENLQTIVSNRSGTRLYIQPDEFVELLLRADLCIGAGGTTTWERLCLNLPSIVITTALNQETFIADLDKAGFLCWLGNKDHVSAQTIKTALAREIREISQIDNMKLQGRSNMVDGYGALRISEIIAPSPKETLGLCAAEISDMENYFLWVNEPEARKYAFTHEIIPWDTHKAWFTEKISSDKTLMWVLQTDQGLPVGQIRFDIENETAEIDYSIDSLVRNQGFAKVLLSKGIKAFKSENNSKNIQALVDNENLSSFRVFQKLGFKEETHGKVTLFRWLK